MTPQNPTLPELGEAESFERWLWRKRARFALALVVIATMIAVAYTIQDYVATRVEDKAIAFWSSASQRFVIWGAWALLAPAVVIAGVRLRIATISNLTRVPAWIVLGLLAGVMHSALYLSVADFTGWPIYAFSPGAGLPDSIERRATLSFAGNLLVFTMLALVYHAVAYAYDLRTRERRELALEARLARSELELLKMQLQPHFIFNALHTVSAVMASDVMLARRVLSRLGELLRFSLDSAGASEVTLGEELANLDRYLDIQRSILAERLQVDVRVEHAARDLLVPSLLLQPLVENAIRHGIEPRASGGCIGVAARCRGDRLIITVADDGHGLIPREPGNGSGERVGLSNTRARLTRLYGTAYHLDLRNRAEGGCEVVVELPARAAGTQDGTP